MKKQLYLKNKEIKSVGVVGLGKSSIGVIDYISHGYKNVSFCLRSDKPVSENDAMCVTKFAKIEQRERAFHNIEEDVLFLSPSVRRDRPELRLAEKSGVLLSSDAELFFEKFTGDVYAVSGSDGKSTTSKILSLLLSERYGTAPAIGNIGEAMSPLINSKFKAAVTELSSFQLMNFSPHAKRALITNISPNHLDWHTSFEEYRAAKENLMRYSEERIFNYDCEYSREMLSRYPAFAVYSSVFAEKELTKCLKAQVYLSRKDGYIIANGEKILDTGAIKAASEHNFINFMAAIAASFGLVSRAHIEKVAATFSGLKHRNEFIGNFGGISYFESSIDSSPKRTVTTLSSHGAVTLILGGRSKGLDYGELTLPLEEKAVAIVLVGENRDEILSAISRGSKISEGVIPVMRAECLEEAVKLAATVTKTGGTVLFSPASTSFDAFKNFEERGDFFTRTVKNYYKN